MDALVEIIPQLTAQLSAMTERLIEAEKGRAEAERDAAIAQAALASAEARLTVMQEQHLAELKELRDRMEAEANKARSELAEWKARPWWRRLAG
jgi:chromosome segregation ATPase